MRTRKSISLLLSLAMVLGLVAAMPMAASAATVDISGSHVVDNGDGTMTLVIKGIAPINVAAGDDIMLMDTSMAYDFTVATATTAAAVTYGCGMSQINFWSSGAFTIPTTGIEIIIGGFVKAGGGGGTLDLVFFGSNDANMSIPVLSGGGGGGGGGGAAGADIELELAVTNAAFSPDWEGNLTASQRATVTVTAKDKTTGLTDAAISGRVVLYTENGPITLINGQAYLYADMANGVGTAEIARLSDMGALTGAYTVGLTAAMPLHDAVAKAPVTLSITPNPLSVTGTVYDDKGSAIAGAQVMLLTADGYMANRANTDAAGRYTLYGSPKSSSYRVIATTDDLYGEVTRDLLVQNTADIILYSQIKVTVNFYRNKATLDGSPNSNVVSPGNLYAAGTYTMEAYSDAQGNSPIAPVRFDGRDAYFRMAELMNAGGRLYIKAIPYSKYHDPFIDNSSLLTEVDYLTAIDPYNIAVDLEETPVGTVTVRNTDNEFPMTVSFESEDGLAQYGEVVIPPGGQYTLAPDEGYKTPAGPIQIFISSKKREVNMKGYPFTAQINRERFLAVVGVGRSSELDLSSADLTYTRSWYNWRLSVVKQFGDLTSLSLSTQYAGNIEDSFSIELPSTLELPSNWRDYLTLSLCDGHVTIPADQLNADYDPLNNILSFRYDSFDAYMVTLGWVPHSYVSEYYFPGLYYPYFSNHPNPYGSCVFTFAVKPKDTSIDIMAHHNIIAYITGVIDVESRATSSGGDLRWFRVPWQPPPLDALSFVTGTPLTLEVPAATNNNKIFVQGYAKPGASVTVSAEGYGSLASFTANQAGRYSGTLTLPDIEHSKDIKLTAASGGKTSNKGTVRYSKRLLYTKELWMQSKQEGSFDKEYLLINQSAGQDGTLSDAQAGKTQNIMVGNEVKFRVKMSDDSAVQKVFVSMETADGKSLGSIPCTLRGNGYWESETQDAGGGSRATSFRVTYVLNLGHEYMSPGEIEANMRETEAALVNWVPPQRMTTDPEAYANELQQAMLDAMPPEMRGANYTDLGGGKTRVSLDLNGQPVSFDQTIEEITGAELNALAAKAQAKGLKLGGGEYYREVGYECALTGGGTRSYTQDEFDRALYSQQQAHPSDSYEQLLANRMGIDSLVMKTTEYMDQPVLGRAEGIRNIVELGTAGAGAVLSYPWMQLAPQWAGNTVGVVNTVVSSLGLPDKYLQSLDARDLANSYEAMYDNFRSLQYTECFSKLNQDYKNIYANQLALMESNMSETSRLKWASYGNTASATLTTVGSAGLTGATFGGGALAKEGLQAFAGNIFNAVGSTIGSFFNYEESFNFQLGAYKDSYNTIQQINNAFKGDMALACGEKQSEKTQGNYNFIHDPQGTVYDGTLDYPVAGVRAELWTADDGEGTAARYWSEAADYDQINPQITEADGMFSWFTPEGWWQVRVFDGAGNAELGRSEWLKVLPPHFGVNINIGGEPLTVSYDPNGGEYPGFELIPDDPDEEGLFPDPFGYPQTAFEIPKGKSHAAIENVFTRDGYEFTGWNTAADGGGTPYAAGAAIDVQTDVTLYAQWKATAGTDTPPPPPPPGGGGTTPPPATGGTGGQDKFTVSFEADGGGAIGSQSVAQNGKAARPADPEKDGYAFAGWYLDKALTKEYDFGAAVTADITLYAKWTETEAVLDNPFGDVDGTDWFFGDVLYAYANGLMIGTSAEPMLFSPNAPLTRAMVVQVFYNIAGKPDANALPNPFADVAEGAWYADAVKWAAESGIVSGYGDGRFGPQDNITREQMAVILLNYERYSGKLPPDIAEAGEFSDRDKISGWAKEAVEKLTVQGIVNGRPGNLFDPQGEATRAEFAAVMRRFLAAVK